MRKALHIIVMLMFASALTACRTTASVPSPTPETAAPAMQTAAPTPEMPSPAAQTPNPPPAPAVKKAGISMPNKSVQYWTIDGETMKNRLEKLGYGVDLESAGDNDVNTQINQIQSMIDSGCNVLIIAAVDGSALVEVLEGAKANNIPVIAYSRLIMNSDAVSYYTTLDNSKVGVLQGQYLIDKLKLDTTKGPYNIELFSGSPDDSSIRPFWHGAMSVLQPYIDSDKLVVKSGQTTEAACTTKDWSSANAQTRMENLIAQYNYAPGGTKLDAVCSASDSIAQGISVALKNAGYTADNFPIITGQDCDKKSIINMRRGFQSMSVFRDTRILADTAATMANEILTGKPVTVNDTTTYNNGTVVIPTYICDPVVYTIKDIGKLVDTGYYTWDDIGGPKGSLPLDGLIGTDY